MKITIDDVIGRFNYRRSDAIDDAAKASAYWRALKLEGAIKEFMTRTGLKHDEVTVVVNARTGKAFPQWKGAVAALPVYAPPED